MCHREMPAESFPLFPGKEFIAAMRSPHDFSLPIRMVKFVLSFNRNRITHRESAIDDLTSRGFPLLIAFKGVPGPSMNTGLLSIIEKF